METPQRTEDRRTLIIERFILTEELKLLLDDLESVSLEMRKLCDDYYNDDLSMTQFSMASARLYSLMKQLKVYQKAKKSITDKILNKTTSSK
jgi:hypothetical protein